MHELVLAQLAAENLVVMGERLGRAVEDLKVVMSEVVNLKI